MGKPLFVSYFGNWKGDHRGFVVLKNIGPVEDTSDIDRLVEIIEKDRGWPSGTVSIASFQRLETAGHQ